MNREKFTTLPLKELHRRLLTGEATVAQVTDDSRAAADEFASTRMFLWRDDAGARARAEQTEASMLAALPLGGLPVSVKDLFDVAGVPTSCGSSFYKDTRAVPTDDAGYVARWRRTGVTFVGKTHLNEFAYGITGENRWFGDCTVPGFPDRLTAGSSSGAAASVAAGAACLALGTDTGGSLRAPAAMCGLVSFRQSLGFAEWGGGFPLARSFDTAGWLQRHLSDMSFVAHSLHPEIPRVRLSDHPRVTLLNGRWMEGVDPDIVAAQARFVDALKHAGCIVTEADAIGWESAPDIYLPIQSHEATRVHEPFLTRFADRYDPAILGRLKLGVDITVERHRELSGERERFVASRVTPLLKASDFVVAPTAPTSKLTVGVDHSATRPRFLKLTTPASLAGLPVLTVPWVTDGLPTAGFQILAPRGADARLWALAEYLTDRGFRIR